MAKRGRKKIEIDPARCRELAAQGLSMDQIAYCIGVHPSTLYAKQKENSDLSDAIKAGRADGIKEVTNHLMQSARDGNVTAQIFYLKNRAPEEWKDRTDRHITGKIDTSESDAEPLSETDRRIAELFGDGEANDDPPPLPH